MSTHKETNYTSLPIDFYKMEELDFVEFLKSQPNNSMIEIGFDEGSV